MTQNSPLTFKLIAKCSTTKARVGLIQTLHSPISTPVFMPVRQSLYFQVYKVLLIIVYFFRSVHMEP